MALDYNGLLTLIVSALDSQITTTQAASLLPLVEARFNRLIDSPLREVEVYQTAVNDPQLPADCWRIRDVWVAGSPPYTLRETSPDAARTLYGNDSGPLVAYTVSGSTLDLWPTPSATSTDVLHIRYQQTIPALSATQTTNWVLTNHPDLYYYGLLLQCEAYIVNDERLGVWKQAFDEALGEVDGLARKQRYGAAPLVRFPYSVA